MELWRVSLLLVLCAGASRALYFHISETEQKCFIEEVPSETMIVGKLGTFVVCGVFVVWSYSRNVSAPYESLMLFIWSSNYAGVFMLKLWFCFI